MRWKTLRRNISYNAACSILDNNHYGITSTEHSFKYNITSLYHNDRLVARYNENTGSLQVITD